MKARYKLLIILGVLLILIALKMFFTSEFYNRNVRALNNKINYLNGGDPANSCIYDSDCEYKSTSCDVCGDYRFVNKKWSKFCPIPVFQFVNCDGFLPSGAICFNNTCASEFIIKERGLIN